MSFLAFLKFKTKYKKVLFSPGGVNKDRLKLITFFISFSFIILIVRSLYVHIFLTDHELLNNIANSQYQKSSQSIPYRGTIFDHRKTPLAISIKTPSLAVNPRIFTPTLKEIIKLSKVLDIDISQIKKITKKTNYFAWLKRKISYKKAQEVKSLAIKGIYEIIEPARFYPNNTSAAHLIGLVGIDNTGLFGLEKAFEDELSGTNKDVLKMKDAKGNAILTSSKSAAPQSLGLNIILTLDNVIQEITEGSLQRWVKASNAKRGFAIVMDPHTGRVLALANRPSFNPNKLSQLDIKHTKNLASAFLFEPGSVIKPLVIARALEKNLTHSNELHYCEKKGRYQVGPKSFIHDDHPKEHMTTEDVLVYSSNICTFKIAQRLGPEDLYKTLKLFGLGSEKSILDLPGDHSGYLSHWKNWRPIRFANISFGQGFFTSGLELVQAYSVFANGGFLIKPYIIERIEDSAEKIIQGPPLELKKKIISSATSEKIRQMLYQTVEKGTATKALLRSFSTAGKTGTSEKYDTKLKIYSKNNRVASFIGFAPAFDPHLLIYIAIDEPQKKPYYGGKWAAPAFGEIVEQALKYLNVAPDKKYAARNLDQYEKQ